MRFNLECPACGHTETRDVTPGPDAPQCPKCLCDMMAMKATATLSLPKRSTIKADRVHAPQYGRRR